jgi:hypothetical protein
VVGQRRWLWSGQCRQRQRDSRGGTKLTDLGTPTMQQGMARRVQPSASCAASWLPPWPPMTRSIEIRQNSSLQGSGRVWVGGGGKQELGSGLRVTGAQETGAQEQVAGPWNSTPQHNNTHLSSTASSRSSYVAKMGLSLRAL